MLSQINVDGAFLVRHGERVTGSFAISFRYYLVLLSRLKKKQKSYFKHPFRNCFAPNGPNLKQLLLRGSRQIYIQIDYDVL